MKYQAVPVPAQDTVLIMPEAGGDAVCLVYKPEFADGIAEALNKASVVQPHPIQEAQHDGVTVIGRAAQDCNYSHITMEKVQMVRDLRNRVGLKNCGILGAKPALEDSDWELEKAVASFNKPAQPQVSESDEAVAYEIRKKVYDLLEKHRSASSGFFAIDEMIDCAIAAILARHRQPAAVRLPDLEISGGVTREARPAFVSADATHAARTAVENIARLRGYEPKQLSDLMDAISDLEPYFQAYGYAFRLDLLKVLQAYREATSNTTYPEDHPIWKARHMHAALSPETVVGGE